jgi:hypothetical protein
VTKQLFFHMEIAKENGSVCFVLFIIANGYLIAYIE